MTITETLKTKFEIYGLIFAKELDGRAIIQDIERKEEVMQEIVKEIEASIRKEVVEEIQEGVRNYKVEKELKSNTLGADYIFVYDLNTFVLKKVI